MKDKYVVRHVIAMGDSEQAVDTGLYEHLRKFRSLYKATKKLDSEKTRCCGSRKRYVIAINIISDMLRNRVFRLPQLSPYLLFKILKLSLTITLTEMNFFKDFPIFELANAY